jgi:hypothetical protein
LVAIPDRNLKKLSRRAKATQMTAVRQSVGPVLTPIAQSLAKVSGGTDHNIAKGPAQRRALRFFGLKRKN